MGGVGAGAARPPGPEAAQRVHDGVGGGGGAGVARPLHVVKPLPDLGRKLVPDLRYHGDVEHGVVGGALHVGDYDHRRVLVGDGLAAGAPLVRTLFGVVHLVEPVGRAGELAPVEYHADGEVRVVDVVVERHAPHDNQSGVQVLDLPTHRATRPSRGSRLLVTDHDLSGGWLYVDCRILFVYVAAVVVRQCVLEPPRRPVFNVQNATHAVIFQPVVLQV